MIDSDPPSPVIWILAILSLSLGLSAPASAADSLRIHLDRKEVHIPAVAHPDRFQGWVTRLSGMPGYHLLVHEKGRSAGNALFTTPAGDRAVHAALIEIGAVPGNVLGMDTWEDRKNPNSAAPDRRIEGSPVEISLLWANLEAPIPLADLLEDPGGKGFGFRFGGHLANAPIWKSGCVVCLYSCPGSKVGNAAYTVRDYVRETTTFRIRNDRFPPEGAPVTLIFRLRPTQEEKRENIK